HRERVVGKIDLLVFLVVFEEREVDDPAQRELVLVGKVQLVGSAVAGLACELVELFRLAGDEEAGIARFQAQLGAKRLGALLADILGKRTGAGDLALLLLPEDVAEAWLTLLLRPGVHAVAECSGTAGL